MKFRSPPYAADIVCEPMVNAGIALDVIPLPTLPSATDPTPAASTLNVSVPVGVPTPDWPVTVPFRKIGVPYVPLVNGDPVGLPLRAAATVVLVSGDTTRFTGVEALEPRTPSPG